MTIQGLDHVSLRTADVDRLTEWYDRVIGLRAGRRPDFDFPGAWLYAGDQPVVHLIGADAPPGADPEDLRIQHFSFRAEGLAGFLDRLRSEGASWRIGRLPGDGFGDVLVNLTDVDGNHLHVDFPAAEAEGLDL